MVLPEQKNYSHMYFNIEAEATVTDGAGESHQSTVSIPLSNHTTVLTCDMPEKSLADSLGNITFGYMNIAGEKIAAKVSYTIDGKQLEANTNEATDIRALRLRSGQHSMTAICGHKTTVCGIHPTGQESTHRDARLVLPELQQLPGHHTDRVV